MGYRLRVPAQLGDWLAGLRESGPATATEVGASLAALMAAEQVPCPPLAVPAGTDDEPSGDADPRELVDYAYQDMLGDLQTIRRQTAHAAAAQAKAELRIAELTGQPEADPAELAAASRQQAEASRRAEQLARMAQRLQAEVDRFRTRRESVKAAYTAAVGAAAVRQSLAKLGEKSDEAETAAAQQAVEEAAKRVEGLLGDARAAQRRVRAIVSGDGAGEADRPARGQSSPTDSPRLLELAADPLGNDIRILFAIDPPGTATLLTVLEGPDAIAEDWKEAATAARMLLEVIRDEGWPPYGGEPDGGGQEFADADQLLAEYFAADGDRIAARAARLAERRPLADLRERAGLSATDVAGAIGISERRLAAIERGGLRQVTLHELTEYLRAVGATLDVTATLDGERQRLT